MSSGLGTKLADSYRQYAQQSREATQKFIEERRMLDTLGPKRWEELRVEFEKTVAEFNAQVNGPILQWSDLADNVLRIVKTNTGAILSGLYTPETHSLAISGPHDWDAMFFEQKVLGDDVRFVTTRRSEDGPRSADEIVDEALRKLIYS